jgi:ABC-2 type transport system ATP-binding protein
VRASNNKPELHEGAGNATIGEYDYLPDNRRASKVVEHSGVEKTPGDGGDTAVHFYYSNRWQIIETRNLIRALGKEHTIILSSHILPEVQAVCSRVLIINKGKIIASDTAENLSRGMTGDNRLSLRVAGDEKEALAIARGIPYVVKADCIGSREPGTVDLVVEAKRDADVRRDVFQAFAKGGLPLLMMKSMDLTLEEIFLNLVTTEKEGS